MALFERCLIGKVPRFLGRIGDLQIVVALVAGLFLVVLRGDVVSSFLRLIVDLDGLVKVALGIQILLEVVR